MVLSLLILPSILNELYKVKNFKSHFFKNLSINFFQILDLSCSHITLKKLLKSFPRHIFSFQDIIKDRCGLVSHFLHMNVSNLLIKFCIDTSKSKSVVTMRISPIFSWHTLRLINFGFFPPLWPLLQTLCLLNLGRISVRMSGCALRYLYDRWRTG